MDTQATPVRQNLLARLKGKFLASGNATEARARRRRAMVEVIGKRAPLLKIALLVVGYLWVLAIPSPELAKGVYMDENALSPGHVKARYSWPEVHLADRWLGNLEQLRNQNASSEERASFISDEFRKLGLVSATQKYTFSLTNQTLSGVNAYAVSASPRTSGTEAIVVSASWLSRRGEGAGDLNLRGIATVLSLAHYLKGQSSWSKDLVFVISDGYLDGMQAWLNTYHNTEQKNLVAEPLPYPSGTVWTAVSIDYSCHSFSHLGIFHEGVNGQLPNQDIINAFERLGRWHGVQTVMYDHVDNQAAPTWIPQFIRSDRRFDNYWNRARAVFRNFGYQARGLPSGIHGLFHRHRIDAFTVYANCADGPHGFYAMGRVVEASMRTMNNLLERLHASFFFYIMPHPHSFNKIGTFIPSAVLISLSMMFQGLSSWIQAGWVLNPASEKADATPQWARRSRQVLPSLLVMVFTHVVGAGSFAIVSSSFVVQNLAALSIPLFISFTAAPLAALAFIKHSHDNSLSLTLKALNLCFASAIISITSVLNFSLALTFAMLLGIPLSLSAFSGSKARHWAGYAFYALVGLGWIPFLQEQTKAALWYWEIASVWFAPVVCIIYVPLVLQAGIATLLAPNN
ncbi:Gaa1-like protein [Coprinopsis sp. MPI-PUGE-AT-0042]|nr:Gaa1-like protein [Coprinopsis sp. MPI-PUGE-AT-0042]